MAAPTYINFDDSTFSNDNTNITFGGGGGGSATSTTNQTPYLSYIFTISSNQNCLKILLNFTLSKSLF